MGSLSTTRLAGTFLSSALLVLVAADRGVGDDGMTPTEPGARDAGTLRHVEAGSRASASADLPTETRAAGPGGGVLIYQNTLGEYIYRPGRGAFTADDLTTLGSSCRLSRYRVRVTGGVEGGGGVFHAEFSLYDACSHSSVGGQLVPGTKRAFYDLADDAAIFHDLEVDVTDRGICTDLSECVVSLQDCGDGSTCVADPIVLPPIVWLNIRFSTDDAAIVMGAPAQIGFSEDGIYEHLGSCQNIFGWPDGPHASFWAEIYAEPDCICQSDTECDDGVFCNGAEFCSDMAVCTPVDPPCARPDLCDEVLQTCHCEVDAHCDDGLFCNGVETCDIAGTCVPGSPPCAPGEVCDEDADQCLCDSHDDCDDGLYCTGVEACGDDGACISGPLPCARVDLCDEATHVCSCEIDDHCADGLYCNGVETCDAQGACQPGSSPCPPNEVCDESTDQCLCDSDDDCDDGIYCNGTEFCDATGQCRPQFDADCNGNGSEDSCDLDQGTSQDCDANAIPDECQTDCDGDGIPDACEVPPIGSLPDCNGNLVPDDCDIAAFHDCCDTRNETGCSNPDIEACVCEADPYCCTHDWDRVCVQEVESLGCASCDVSRDCNNNDIPDECEMRGRMVGFIGYPGNVAVEFDVDSGASFPLSGTGLRGPGDLHGLAFNPREGILFGSDTENGLLFRIDPGTGSSTLVAVHPYRNVYELACDPASGTLYGINDVSELLSINTDTGVVTRVGPLGISSAAGLAFDVAKGVLITSQGLTNPPSLYTIDPTSGTASRIDMELPTSFGGLAFDDAMGTLFGMSGDKLYVIDIENGTYEFVGEANLFYVYGLAFDASRDVLFAAKYDQSTSRLVHIDKQTGAGTPAAPLGFGSVDGLAFDGGNGRLFGFDHNLDMVFTIDQETGRGSAAVSVDVDTLGELAYDSRRDVLLAGNSDTNEIVSIDPITGHVSPMAFMGVDVHTMAYDATSDTVYATNANRLYGFDPSTGGVWTVGFLSVEYVGGLAFDPAAGVLIGVRPGELLEIDPQDGHTLATQRLPSSMTLYNLALDETTGLLYSTHFMHIGRSSSQLVAINRNVGTVSFVGQLGFNYTRAWTLDASSNRLYAMWGGELITIDPHTGEGTTRGLRFGETAANAMTFDTGAGELLGVRTRLMHIDTETGWGSETGAILDMTGIGGTVVGLAYDPATDTLIGLSDSYGWPWFSIDRATGVTTLIGWSESYIFKSIAFNTDDGHIYATGKALGDGTPKLCKLYATSNYYRCYGDIGFTQVVAIAFDTTTGTLYGVDTSTDQLIVLDTGAGTGEAIGPTGFSNVTGLAFDPRPHVLYGYDSATNQVVILDTGTGAGTAVGPLGIPNLIGLASDPQSGSIFGVDGKLDSLVTLDPLSGEANVIGPLSLDRVEAIAFDPKNQTLFGVTQGMDDFDQLVTIDTALGTATPVGPLNLELNDPRDLAFDPDAGKLFGSDWYGKLYEIDTNTGAATLIGPDRLQPIEGLAFLSRGAIDCNADFRLDSCELEDNDCNGNGLPDDCEDDSDCNANGQRDFCDLSLGLSPDCNGNLTPDECELVGNDCNQNAIPDDCEIRFHDCNGNGVLDECDPPAEPDGGIRHIRTRLLASDPVQGDSFGEVVAIDGDLAIVGAPGKRDQGSNSGAVYVYERNTSGFWQQIKKLIEVDAAPGKRFGEAVAISGNRIVVGSPGGDNYGIPSGAAYLYERNLGGPNAWGMASKLTAFDGEADDAFGGSVAIDGDIAVIGARLHGGRYDIPQCHPGAAYVFRHYGGSADGWFLNKKLEAVDDQCLLEFGSSVAISRQTIVVGAPHHYLGVRDIGSAYIYDYDTASSSWIVSAQLLAENWQDGAAYGQSVAIDGDWVAIGAPNHVLDNNGTGLVYLYERNTGGAGTWGEAQRLAAADETIGSFGSDVSIGQSSAIIGAQTSDSTGIDSGAAFLFVRRSQVWEVANQLLGCDTSPHDAFGSSVDLSSNTVIIGADRNTIGLDSVGSAYLFTTYCGNGLADPGEQCDDGNLDSGDGCSAGCSVEDGFACIGNPSVCGTDCNGNGAIDATDLANHTSLDCNANGIPDECDTDCNGNQVPDDCDLASGTSLDCQSNGIPDECETDCNDNGVPDDCDLTSGTSTDCNQNSIPDECEPDCNQNGVTDSCDLTGGQSEDCNGNVVPDECDIDNGVSLDCQPNGVPDECEADCNANGLPDDCDIQSGSSTDCNGNGVPDECEPDCNTNGVPDDCDIANGPSVDCNANGIPDECELADGTDTDCNGNSVLDGCDIAGGTSADCQTNGIPDECEITDGTSLDCNANTVPDVCDIRDGASQDCQLNDVPDECESDCNGNTLPDDCDIGTGASSDCNHNLVPDECDIAIGTSRDCQPNGTPDECELAADGRDCNGNGVPDDCDIATGVSVDCNGNGVPDACELSDGTARDCNFNSIPDECDIVEGTSADCQSNGIPDECDIGVEFTDSSETLAPIDDAHPQSHVILYPPAARSSVKFTIFANADLSRPSEYLDVQLNGLAMGTVFVSGGIDCAYPPVSDELTITADQFNDTVAGGPAVIDIIPSVGVDPGICSQSTVSITTTYAKAGASEDCNLNQVPDACDVMGPDYDNNGLIDLADYEFLLTCWEGPNAVRGPDDPACLAACTQGFDVDLDGDVDLHDVGAFQGAFAP